jgi:hypothetical protein
MLVLSAPLPVGVDFQLEDASLNFWTAVVIEFSIEFAAMTQEEVRRRSRDRPFA